MVLKEIITKVFHKQLRSSELLAHENYHAHELSGVAGLKKFFESTEDMGGKMDWYYFEDDIESKKEKIEFHYYDARRNKPKRSEWRLYPKGEFLSNFNEGDWCFFIEDCQGQKHGLFFHKDSAFLRAAKNFFNVEETGDLFEEIDDEKLCSRELQFLQRIILEEIGLGNLIEPSKTDEELVIKEFGHEFPETKTFSQFARNQTDVENEDDDITLIRWLDREYELFKALEKLVVEKKIKKGFKDIESFLELAKSTTNRRAVRMGLGFENQLEELFKRSGLNYSRGAFTELRKKPDFIFPGSEEYQNKEYPESSLYMLGAKSSCKERWRQILTEAERIKTKHLCTLEAAISEHQTAEMRESNIVLVVPSPLQTTYKSNQKPQMIDVAGFVELIRHNQS